VLVGATPYSNLTDATPSSNLADATPSSNLVPGEIAIFAGGCPPASKETTVLAGDIGVRQQCGFSKSTRKFFMGGTPTTSKSRIFSHKVATLRGYHVSNL
jgi:hypothetical protein